MLICCLSTAACTQDQADPQVVGTLERDRVELIAEAQEPIVRVAVREGDAVVAGQVLVVLDDRLYDALLAQARARTNRAEQRLAELQRGPRRERIMEARARLAGMNSRRIMQEREYKRTASLVARHLVSASALDRARTQRGIAHASRDQAAARLQTLLNGATAEQLAQARSARDAARASLHELQIHAQRLIVRAPRDGIVDALPYHLGERPSPGAPVAVLLAGGIYARVYIPEPLRAHVRPGASANIHVEGLRAAFPGRVRFISSEAAFTPYFALNERDRSRLTYLAKIYLTGPKARALPVGVPVTASFPPRGKAAN